MTGCSIAERPASPDYVRFDEGFGQRFIVTVDTEEEFDWGQPTTRDRHGVSAVPALRRFQSFCEEHGVAPVYLMDHPVAASAAAREALADALSTGRAEAGVHLHPWVNPPFEEDVTEFNSFAGNLPAELEREKFARLRRTIAAQFGAAPIAYRAGRYGAGPNTAAILAEHGIAIDSSVRPLFDYSATGGPDYSRHPLRPYWIDRAKGLLELPVTSVYWGLLRRQGGWLYPRAGRVPRLRGALARLGLLERIPLTPEGLTAEEALRGIDIALDEGLPLLVFSFHSPSLAPGNTPYVRSAQDLENFYDWWRQVFACLARRQVAPSSMRDIAASVALASRRQAS